MTAQHRKEALARALAMQWAADVPFRRALLRLYRTHCRNLPAGPGAAVPDPLRDAIAAHYGRPVVAPSTRPAFARMTRMVARMRIDPISAMMNWTAP